MCHTNNGKKNETVTTDCDLNYCFTNFKELEMFSAAYRYPKKLFQLASLITNIWVAL